MRSVSAKGLKCRVFEELYDVDIHDDVPANATFNEWLKENENVVIHHVQFERPTDKSYDERIFVVYTEVEE